MPYPVIAEERAEVRGFLLVDQLNKAGTVHCVNRGEDAAREETKLQELCYRLILRRFCRKMLKLGQIQLYFQ